MPLQAGGNEFMKCVDKEKKLIYNPQESREAEIKKAIALTESGRMLGLPQAQPFKWTAERAGETVWKYPATGRDRYIAGNVLAFPKEPGFSGKQGGTAVSIVPVPSDSEQGRFYLLRRT